jgi:nitrogen fixation NifU-like protein
MFTDNNLNIQKKWNGFVEIFNKKNLARKECLLLPLRTVAKALKI